MNTPIQQGEQSLAQEAATTRRRNIFCLACCAIVNTIAAREVYWNTHNHALAYVLGGVAIVAGSLASIIYIAYGYGPSEQSSQQPVAEKAAAEPAVDSSEDSSLIEDPKDS
jgi:hypothetical protein